MQASVNLHIAAQPDDSTCGPTCLQAVYGFYGDAISLPEVVAQVHRLENGGTLAVLLGCHALRRGYSARIYTWDLRVFDPTWFHGGRVRQGLNVAAKLEQQAQVKGSRRLAAATKAYLEFLRLGGELRFQDLDGELLRRQLRQGRPLLAGLSATYLYGTARELEQGDRLVYDDIKGMPAGHFVVLSGWNAETRQVRVADPLHPNPAFPSQYYDISLRHLLSAIMLGILTYDANMLLITPKESR